MLSKLLTLAFGHDGLCVAVLSVHEDFVIFLAGHVDGGGLVVGRSAVLEVPSVDRFLVIACAGVFVVEMNLCARLESYGGVGDKGIVVHVGSEGSDRAGVDAVALALWQATGLYEYFDMMFFLILEALQDVSNGEGTILTMNRRAGTPSTASLLPSTSLMIERIQVAHLPAR